MSALFKLATKAARRSAMSAWRRSDVGRMVTDVAKYKFLGKTSTERIQAMTREAKRTGGTRVEREIRRAGGLSKYAMSMGKRAALNELFRSLGPMGDVLRGILMPPGGGTPAQAQIRAAKELLRTFGYEVIGPEGVKALEGLDDTGRNILQALLESGAIEGDRGRPKPAEETWPEEIAPEPTERTDVVGAMEDEILTPKSSNVFSFSFQRESKSRGILYVTFMRPRMTSAVGKRRGGVAGELTRVGPGAAMSGKVNARGAMYAYYDVPTNIYTRMRAVASRGKFVWDHLRIRGTIYGHQYIYQLVDPATIIQEDGVIGNYVPRKATRRGYRSRTLPIPGTGRRAFMQSTLPERGIPDRGEPDRAKSIERQIADRFIP